MHAYIVHLAFPRLRFSVHLNVLMAMCSLRQGWTGLGRNGWALLVQGPPQPVLLSSMRPCALCAHAPLQVFQRQISKEGLQGLVAANGGAAKGGAGAKAGAGRNLMSTEELRELFTLHGPSMRSHTYEVLLRGTE